MINQEYQRIANNPPEDVRTNLQGVGLCWRHVLGWA